MHKPSSVLTAHTGLCLSNLQNQSRLLRADTHFGCHCHYRSGYSPTVLLISSRSPAVYINNKVLAYGSPRLTVVTLHRKCCTLFALIFNFQNTQRQISASIYKGMGEVISKVRVKNFVYMHKTTGYFSVNVQKTLFNFSFSCSNRIADSSCRDILSFGNLFVGFTVEIITNQALSLHLVQF